MPIQHTRDFVLQVKELLSRNLDAIEIAHRMHVDINIVREFLNTLI